MNEGGSGRGREKLGTDDEARCKKFIKDSACTTVENKCWEIESC